VLWYGLPAFRHDFAIDTQLHHPIHHISKQTLPIFGTDCYKIDPGLGIVVAFETERPPLRFKLHSCPCYHWNW
jgi:hypothetical protein